MTPHREPPPGSKEEVLELSWAGPDRLQIAWADGHVSTYTVNELRRRCPCANCRTARAQSQKKGSLVVLKGPVTQQVAARRVEPVGNYALRLTFSDGHKQGLYSFSYLRNLCPCQKCMSQSTTG